MTDARDPELESGEEQIDAQGRNPTQQRMDEEGVEPAPVDAAWGGEDEGDGPPVAAAGPAAAGGSFATGAAPVADEPVFEPDVALVGEVNREASRRTWRRVALVGGALALLAAVRLRRRR